MTTNDGEEMTSTINICGSYEEAKEFINEHEKKHVVQFSLQAGAKKFGSTDIFAKSHAVRFATTKVPYNGVPFQVLNYIQYECMYGKGKTKDKVKKMNTKGNRPTHKIGCPVSLILTEIATYPDHAIDKDTARKRKYSSIELRKALEAKDTNAIGKVERKFIVQLPDISEHKGHPIGEEAGKFQTLDKQLIEKINQLVGEGVISVKEMKRCLKVYVQEICGEDDLPTKTNKRFYPSERIIRNHIYQAKKKFIKAMVDQVSLLGKIKEWQEKKPDAKIFFRPNGEDSDILAKDDEVENVADETQKNKSSLLFIYQEDYQRGLLQRYGDELSLLDPAYRRAKYLLPLYFVLVRTNVDYQVAAVFIIESEGKEEIMEALHVLREWNPCWTPKYFMTDYCNEEIDAVQKVFDSKVVLSDFLREQLWKDWLSKLNNDCRDIKGFLLPMMRSIARSTLVDCMEKAIGILKGCQYWEERTKFKEYFSTYWLRKKELWVWAYREHRMHVNVNTNNGIESQNEYLKYEFMENHQNTSLTGLCTVLVEEFYPSSFDRYCDLNKKAYTSYYLYSKEIMEVAPYLINRPTALVKHCLDRINSTNASDKSDIYCTDNGMFKVLSFGKNQNISYDVSFGDLENMPYCSCPDWRSSLFPCKHFFAIIQKYPRDLSWESLPGIYRDSPFLTLDIAEEYLSTIDVGETIVEQVCSIDNDDEDADCYADGGGHSDSPVDEDVSYVQSHHTGESSRAIIKEIKEISYDLTDPCHLNELYESLKEVRNRFKPLAPTDPNARPRAEKDRASEKPAKRRKRKLHLW